MKSLITKGRLISIGVILLLLYASKPDKGGVWACSKIFGLSELSNVQLDHKPFWNWEIFESSKYRFRISPEEFSKLQLILDKHGYSEWKNQGLTYDSVSIGWEGDDDFIVTKKQDNGMVYYWSYSRDLNVIYAISWNN